MSSFLTQTNFEEVNENRNDLIVSGKNGVYTYEDEEEEGEENYDAEYLLREEQSFLPNVSSPSRSPVAVSPRSSKSISSPIMNTQQLMKDLITKQEDKTNMIFLMNKTEITNTLQQSLEELQHYFEAKLATKEQESRHQEIVAKHQLAEKDQEIANLQQQLLLRQQKYAQLQKKCSDRQYQAATKYSSSYSLQRVFQAWKQHVLQKRQIQRIEKLIQRYQKQYYQEKYFLLLASQFQIEKKQFQIKDLQFKYDTISSEMVLKYEQEITRLRQEVSEAYQTISEEEKKRLFLEEELRKVLLKNMTTMNVEAFNLFQHINKGSAPPASSQLQQKARGEVHSTMNLDESMMSGTSETSQAKAISQSLPQSLYQQQEEPSPKPSILSTTPSPFQNYNYPAPNPPITTAAQQQQQSSRSSSNGHHSHHPPSSSSSASNEQQLFNMNSASTTASSFSASDVYVSRLSAMYHQSVSAGAKLAKLPPQLPNPPASSTSSSQLYRMASPSTPFVANASHANTAVKRSPSVPKYQLNHPSPQQQPQTIASAQKDTKESRRSSVSGTNRFRF